SAALPGAFGGGHFGAGIATIIHTTIIMDMVGPGTVGLWLVTTGRTKSPGPDSKVDHWSFSVIAKYRAKNSSAAWMMMPARAPRQGRICVAETINAAVINQIDGFFGMSLGALVI